MRQLLLSVLFLPFAGCSSDSEPNPVPADATALSSYAKSGATTLVTRMTNFEAIVPFVLNPGSPGAGGLTFTPTGAPNTYTFGMPIDGDGNGATETTIAGTAAFGPRRRTGKPASGTASGVGGSSSLGASRTDPCSLSSRQRLDNSNSGSDILVGAARIGNPGSRGDMKARKTRRNGEETDKESINLLEMDALPSNTTPSGQE